jgi:murein DD-endopeptidase MepM/ murein hydrolase activator NlpD
MSKTPPPASRQTGREAKRRSQTRIFIAKGDSIRAVPLSPRLIGAGAIALAVFSVLYFSATLFLVLRDDPVESASQTTARDVYEDRIAALRTEIDKIRSRGMIDHATVDEKVDLVLSHQKSLDARQTMLGALTDAARRAGFDMPPSAKAPEAIVPDVPVAVSPAGPSFGDMGLRTSPIATTPLERQAAADRLSHIDTQLSAMAGDQMAVVGTMANRISTRADKIASVLKRLGRKVPAAPEEDVGGPFVPLPEGSDDAAFHAGISTLSDELNRLAEIRRIAMSLPLRQPIPNAQITSLFGPRLDPFLGRPAMHTGIDFRAAEGSPARAVAAGRVIAAEYNGGYGNMVDIDHGNGVVTRYGHLSAISVRIGQTVAAGTAIGRIGETGRATGPHLHYEIRIDGEPIDPTRYIKAGEQISAWL